MGVPTRGRSTREKKAALLAEVRKIKQAAGVDLHLESLGVHRSDVPVLSEKALRDPCLITNPRRANRRDIEVLYEESL